MQVAVYGGADRRGHTRGILHRCGDRVGLHVRVTHPPLLLEEPLYRWRFCGHGSRLGSNEKVQMTLSAFERVEQGPLGLICFFSPGSVRHEVTSSHAHRISIEGRPMGHLSRSLERLGHLPRGGLKSSGMPHEGYVDPIINNCGRTS